jgi:hypothetical protein
MYRAEPPSGAERYIDELGELAESLPLDAVIGSRAEHSSGDEGRRALLKICADLREVADQLTQMCRTLPKPTAIFHAQGELRGTLECVRTDLLEDAISTLRTAARRGCESEWRYAFEERVKLEADQEGRRR